jgi:hypothetical protein
MNVGAINARTPVWMPLNPPKHRVPSVPTGKPTEQPAPATPMTGSSIRSPRVEATRTAAERLPASGPVATSGIQLMSDSGASKRVENATAFVYRLQKLCSMVSPAAAPAQSNVSAE